MFREGISTLAPSKEIRALFEKGPARHESDLPDTYEVTVTYTDQTGKRAYEEKIDLDFGLYWIGSRSAVATFTMSTSSSKPSLKRLRTGAQASAVDCWL